MKICFSARPAYDVYSAKIFTCLQQGAGKPTSGVFVTTNQQESEYIQSQIVDAVIFEVASYFKDHWDEFTLEALSLFEQKYNCAPIWKYIYTDRFLISADYDYAVHITAGYFSFYEKIFSAKDIDIYYDEVIATLASYVAYIVGTAHGATYITQMAARGFEKTHHYISSDPLQHNVNFNSDYKNKKYTDSVMKMANDFLTSFESQPTKPWSMAAVPQLPTLSLKKILGSAKWYLSLRFSKYSNDPCSYMYYKNYSHCFDDLKFYFRYKKSRKYYCQPDLAVKYVYFPLHYQPEASTSVCAPKYEKQLFFIDSWAKSLPADTVLYIKEHYARLGHRDPDFYRQLKHYPNVFLIDPLFDSRILIERAFAVTTLTGTAGWEAMLLRKPVLLSGKIYFDNAPGVIQVDDIFDNFIGFLDNWKEPSRQDVLQYLYEYCSTLYEGNIYAEREIARTDENIARVVASLKAQIRRIGGTT